MSIDEMKAMLEGLTYEVSFPARVVSAEIVRETADGDHMGGEPFLQVDIALTVAGESFTTTLCFKDGDDVSSYRDDPAVLRRAHESDVYFALGASRAARVRKVG